MINTALYCLEVQNTSDENIAVVMAGINDLSAFPPEEVYGRIKELCLKLKKCGFTRVVVGTLASAHEGLDAARVTYNTYIRAGWDTFADEMFDVGADPTMGPIGAYANLTYYNADGLHPNDSGYAIIASVCQTAINRLWSKIGRYPYSVYFGVTTISSTPYTITASDFAVYFDASSAPITALLPPAVGNGRGLRLKKVDTSGNVVVFKSASGETIDGAAAVTTGTPYAAMDVIDGASTKWWVH
jgi:hypothetical protein